MIIQDIYDAAAASTDGQLVDPVYTVVYNFDCSSPASERHDQQALTHAMTTSTGSGVPAFPSSPSYHDLPVGDSIRMPLAPIMTNTPNLSHLTSSPVGGLMDYDAMADYDSLLPPIGASSSSPSAVDSSPVPGTLSWYTSGAYLHANYGAAIFSLNGGAYAGGLQGGVEPEGFGYPHLYSY